MKKLMILSIVLLAGSLSNLQGAIDRNFYNESPAKVTGETTPFAKRYGWKYAHLRLENMLNVPVEFQLYKKDLSGNVVPVMKPDAKGNDTDQIDTYRVNPGKDNNVYFLIRDHIFDNPKGKAVDHCIYQVDAFMLDPQTGKRTGERWSGGGKWCMEHITYKSILGGGKGKGYYGWIIQIRDKKDAPGQREIVQTATHTY